MPKGARDAREHLGAPSARARPPLNNSVAPLDLGRIERAIISKGVRLQNKQIVSPETLSGSAAWWDFEVFQFWDSLVLAKLREVEVAFGVFIYIFLFLISLLNYAAHFR